MANEVKEGLMVVCCGCHNGYGTDGYLVERCAQHGDAGHPWLDSEPWHAFIKAAKEQREADSKEIEK